MWEPETLSLFSFLKRKPPPSRESGDSAPTQAPLKPRACRPTFVTNEKVILSKAAASVRDTREIRLVQAFAAAKKLRLVLAIRPSAQLQPSLATYLSQHGVEISEAQMEDYSVYIGHALANGQESDGWVLGNSGALAALKQSARSLWLRDRLRIGATFEGDTLLELENALLKENSRMQNIDGEIVRDALLSLIKSARGQGGALFIQ